MGINFKKSKNLGPNYKDLSGPPIIGENPQVSTNIKGKSKKKGKAIKNGNTPGYVGPAQGPKYVDTKHWGIKAVAMMLVIAIMMGLTYANLTGGLFTEPGITANMELSVVGRTLSELAAMEFTVANKNNKDVSADTKWSLNNILISQGYNRTKIDVSKLDWGSNYLEAMNGDDKVVFLIELEKDFNSSDITHRIMSAMNEYGDGWYETGESYIDSTNEEITNLVKASYDSIDYGNGALLTRQKFRGGMVSLETTETVTYSLKMGYPLYLPDTLANDYAVEVSGNWDNVNEARLQFDLNGTSQEEWVAVRYKNGKLYTMPKDDVTYSNGKLSVKISQDGIYMLRPAYLDNSNLVTRYDIAIFELYDTDIIRTSDLTTEPTLSQADASAQLSTEFYTELLNKIYDDAESKSNAEIQFNLLTWYRNVAMLNKDGIKFIRNYSASSVEESLKTLLDKIQTNIYQKFGLVIFDISSLSDGKVKQVAELIAEYSNFVTYDMRFIVISETDRNLRSLAEIPSDVSLYEVNNSNEAKSLISSINSGFNRGSIVTVNPGNDSLLGSNSETGEQTTTQENSSEISARILYDTGFNPETNGLSAGTGISSFTNLNNTFGVGLLSKLAYNSRFSAELIAEKNCLRDGYSTVDGVTINLPTITPTVNSTNVELINSGEGNTLDTTLLTDIANMLDLSQFNYSGGMLKAVSSYDQDGGYTYFIEKLIDKMKVSGPVLANLKCGFGSSTVLITKVSQDQSDMTKFYLHIFQPFNPGVEDIVELKFYTGISTSNKIGYGCTVSYTFGGTKFNSLSIIDEVSIFQNNSAVLVVE